MTDNIIDLLQVKARAAGVDPQFQTLIQQLNQRFSLHIESSDPRLQRFKSLHPVLEQTAQTNHKYSLEEYHISPQDAFLKGVEFGKTQALLDFIVCLLEADGIITKA
jgi:hypothetical protein